MHLEVYDKFLISECCIIGDKSIKPTLCELSELKED